MEGIINTTATIPKGKYIIIFLLTLIYACHIVIQGVMSIVTSVHEGIHNAPKLYGSAVREPGKVTDFSSGVKEAGKVPLPLLIADRL